MTSETRDEKHRLNASALDDFATRLGIDPVRAGNEDAWITAFASISGDGTWMPEATDVAIAKLVTNRRTA